MRVKGLLMLLLGTVLTVPGMSSMAATQAQIDSARISGLWWMFTHQNGEGSWGAASATVTSTATTLEALNTAGLRGGMLYSRGYSWLANTPTLNIDSLSRQIAAVQVSGGDTSVLVSTLLAARNSQLSWGAYAAYDTSYPDTALAINVLLPITTYTNSELQSALCKVFEGKRADGGWSFTKSSFPSSTNSTIMPSAYNLLILDAARASRSLLDNYGCNMTYYFNSTISAGLAWLVTQRNLADNGFGAGGVSSVMETAFAYQALNKLSPTDPATAPALDYLLSKQSAVDGSWNGDAFQTALVMKLLPAPLTPLVDTDGDGMPDAVEVLAGTNPIVSDSRDLATGNGQSTPGLTIPIVLSQAILGQPYSYSLAPSGGTAPYVWYIASGSLPLGLTLNTSSGHISGTPTVLGVYPFSYTVTDSLLVTATAVGQIDVYLSAPSLADGDINGDGVVDAADVLLVERMALGLLTPTLTQLQHADVSPTGSPDGAIDAADVIRIRLKALGLISW